MACPHVGIPCPPTWGKPIQRATAGSTATARNLPTGTVSSHSPVAIPAATTAVFKTRSARKGFASAMNRWAAACTQRARPTTTARLPRSAQSTLRPQGAGSRTASRAKVPRTSARPTPIVTAARAVGMRQHGCASVPRRIARTNDDRCALGLPHDPWQGYEASPDLLSSASAARQTTQLLAGIRAFGTIGSGS